MLIQDFDKCEEIIAGDNSILREFLHPNKQKVDLRYSLAHAIIKPGNTSSPHRLKTSEVYFILEGEEIMHIGQESETVHANQTIYIPPLATQYIKNTGKSDLKFLCIVDPAWKVEDEEII